MFSVILRFEKRYLSRGKRSISGDESEGETRRALVPSVACIFTRWRACPSLDGESLHTGQRGIVSVWTTFFIRPFIILIRFLCVYILYYLIYCADVIVKSVQKDLNEDV